MLFRSANYTDGDKFDGLTRKVGFDRMIPPHALEVCYNKTTHIIFPAEITYVDLGNENLVAGLADGAKNVLRVKSAFKSFTTILVLLCIFILGGDAIRSFTFAMLFGVIIGTLATIYVAAPVAYLTDSRRNAKAAKAAK